MINAVILLLHIAFAFFLFIKKLRKDSFQSALVNLILFIIIFTIGWSLSTTLVQLLIPSENFTEEINYDSISLMFLTAVEIPFYRFFFKDIFISGGKGIQ